MKAPQSECANCGHAIEDHGLPRMSGPEYPLWVHLHNGSLRCRPQDGAASAVAFPRYIITTTP